MGVNFIKTRHIGNGRIVQTQNGRVIFRGIPRDFPVSPDSKRVPNPHTLIEERD